MPSSGVHDKQSNSNLQVKGDDRDKPIFTHQGKEIKNNDPGLAHRDQESRKALCGIGGIFRRIFPCFFRPQPPPQGV
ncbi:hypothetical protein GUJ93_ZPchr0006g44305 [Zizania palustris]|uniref:Uncharacterized protein n=1 Tax=Zizania palustris TaxID=103762 RepID=A0A8J5TB23_ZIZPA|nr:hypothetical protein GUJ93_ZPchr0006g44305 [Zizania palustris]